MSTDEATTDTPCPTEGPCGCPNKSRGLTYGAWLLRLWLAVRAIQTGIEKFAGTTMTDKPVNIDGAANSYGLSAAAPVKEYALSHYHGVPDALFSKFAAEPLMRLPGPIETTLKELYKRFGGSFDGVKLSLADATDTDSTVAAAAAWAKFLKEPLMLNVYNLILGPALLVLGVTILLGIASRVSLLFLGLLYISLTWGLILIKQDDGVSWLGVHLILIVMALALAEHNRFTLFKKW